MEMGEKIQSLRLEKGLTLEQVGNYVGVGKATVLKWEKGIIQNMRRDKIAKLAYILGTTPDYLMGWENDATPTLSLSAQEQAIILAYREKTEMQSAVNTLLGIQPEGASIGEDIAFQLQKDFQTASINTK